MADLAAVVEKPRAETTIDALRAEGVYDETRRVCERDADTVELPVTAPPAATPILDVVDQVAPERRSPDLRERLRARGWSADDLDRVPASWAVVGSVVLVAFGDCPRPAAVGEELLAIHGEADTVLAREGVAGEHREPDVRVVAGVGETETVHTEHGTKYALDLSRVMFSPGNQRERTRMGEVVEPGERVLDTFAGVGYFTLPMARAGAVVTAVERNPEAFRFLLENAVLNGVEARVSPVRGDCRDVAPAVGPVDRVVMGYYDAVDYLDAALPAVRSGGVVHVHAAVPDARLWDRPEQAIRRAAAAAGRDADVEGRRRVKSYSEGVWHVVCDVRVH